MTSLSTPCPWYNCLPWDLSSSSSMTKWWGRAASQDGGLDPGLEAGGDGVCDSSSSLSKESLFPPNKELLKAWNSQLFAGTVCASLGPPSTESLSLPLPPPGAYFFFHRLARKLDIRNELSGAVNHITAPHSHTDWLDLAHDPGPPPLPPISPSLTIPHTVPHRCLFEIPSCLQQSSSKSFGGIDLLKNN